MKQVIYYTLDDGGYVMDYTCADDLYPNPPEAGQGVVEVENISAPYDMQFHYVDTGTLQVLPRPVMALNFSPIDRHVPADGATEVVVSGIPPDTVVTAVLPEGQATEIVNDGVIDIASYASGEGVLNFVSNRYISEWAVGVYFD